MVTVPFSLPLQSHILSSTIHTTAPNSNSRPRPPPTFYGITPTPGPMPLPSSGRAQPGRPNTTPAARLSPTRTPTVPARHQGLSAGTPFPMMRPLSTPALQQRPIRNLSPPAPTSTPPAPAQAMAQELLQKLLAWPAASLAGQTPAAPPTPGAASAAQPLMTPIAPRAPLLGVTMRVPGVPEVAMPVQFLDKELGKPLSEMAWEAVQHAPRDDGVDRKARYSTTAKLQGIPDAVQNPRNAPFQPREKSYGHSKYNADNVHETFTAHPTLVSGMAAFEGMYPSADGTPPKYDRDSTAVKDFLKDVTLLMGSLTARMVGAVASGQYATWRKHLEALKGCESWSSELNGCAPTICKPLHATDLARQSCLVCALQLLVLCTHCC